MLSWVCLITLATRHTIYSSDTNTHRDTQTTRVVVNMTVFQFVTDTILCIACLYLGGGVLWIGSHDELIFQQSLTYPSNIQASSPHTRSASIWLSGDTYSTICHGS